MPTVVITKLKEFDYDISVFQDGKRVRKAWSNNLQQAYGKADILAGYFTDDNGQAAATVVNDCSKG